MQWLKPPPPDIVMVGYPLLRLDSSFARQFAACDRLLLPGPEEGPHIVDIDL